MSFNFSFNKRSPEHLGPLFGYNLPSKKKELARIGDHFSGRKIHIFVDRSFKHLQLSYIMC